MLNLSITHTHIHYSQSNIIRIKSPSTLFYAHFVANHVEITIAYGKRAQSTYTRYTSF